MDRPTTLDEQIRWLADRLRDADRVVCMTGAGISAESGVPTFRGDTGMWEGERVEDVATPEGFARDPARVWRFYNGRRKGLMSCRPNPAHYALAKWEKHCKRFLVITQNVDGLHQQAGSEDVVPLHGDIWIDRCTRCGKESRAIAASDEIPNCADCGAMCRPGIVWFGEMLPTGALERAAEESSWADLMLVIGTSSLVYPAAGVADYAKEHGATVVEVNLAATALSSRADVVMQGKAGEVLSAVQAIWPGAAE